PDGYFELPANQTYTLSIEFHPNISGTRERGTVTLRSCANSACEDEIRVTGLGIESGLVCSPGALAFGQVNPGHCLNESVTCENIGHEPLTIVRWGSGNEVARPTSEDFEIEPSAVRVLSQGEQSQIDVSFCPTRLGNHSGALFIDSDQPRPRIFVDLSGAGGGPNAEDLPEQLAFGL
ncbi:unnamed protein product, partial [Laminaria digitata]